MREQHSLQLVGTENKAKVAVLIRINTLIEIAVLILFASAQFSVSKKKRCNYYTASVITIIRLQFFMMVGHKESYNMTVESIYAKVHALHAII